MTETDPKSIDSIAENLADAVCQSISSKPGDYGARNRELEDLKLKVVRAAAGLGDDAGPVKNEFLWNLAAKLPDFNTDALYQKRSTVISLAAAVLVGWLLGGLLSGLLNFLALGGEIIRPLTIFCIVWLGEYLGSNPRSRKIFLTVLGLGGLTRFCAMLSAGMARFTGFASIRQTIFGAARPNIFKGAWLLVGAFFMFVFLSKKISALDLAAFKDSLIHQIKQDLLLARFAWEQRESLEKELAQARQEADAGAANNADGKLGASLLGMLDSLDADKRAFLLEKLNDSGFETRDADEDTLIWNEKEDAPFYDVIGMVKDGDVCKILARAGTVDGRIIKGHVQRLERQTP